MVTTRPPKTIVKPTALGPVANTDTKLLIYGLFQKGRVLAQDGIGHITLDQKCAGARSAGNPHAACDAAGGGNGDMVRTEAPALGESRRQQLLSLSLSTAPAPDPTNILHAVAAKPPTQ